MFYPNEVYVIITAFCFKKLNIQNMLNNLNKLISKLLSIATFLLSSQQILVDVVDI